jgi:hypothetical protein
MQAPFGKSRGLASLLVDAGGWILRLMGVRLAPDATVHPVIAVMAVVRLLVVSVSDRFNDVISTVRSCGIDDDCHRTSSFGSDSLCGIGVGSVISTNHKRGFETDTNHRAGKTWNTESLKD